MLTKKNSEQAAKRGNLQFQIPVKFQSETALCVGCGICQPSGNPQGIIMWKPRHGHHSSLEPGKEDKEAVFVSSPSTGTKNAGENSKWKWGLS